MRFAAVLPYLEAGRRVRRPKPFSDAVYILYKGVLGLYSADVPPERHFITSQSADLLASDWEVVEEPAPAKAAPQRLATAEAALESVEVDNGLLRAQSDSWRRSWLLWQRWATELTDHGQGGSIGDRPMREQITSRIAKAEAELLISHRDAAALREQLAAALAEVVKLKGLLPADTVDEFAKRVGAIHAARAKPDAAPSPETGTAAVPTPFVECCFCDTPTTCAGCGCSQKAQSMANCAFATPGQPPEPVKPPAMTHGQTMTFAVGGTMCLDCQKPITAAECTPAGRTPAAGTAPKGAK